ncbi:hypothetical protein BV911_17445 [Pseudoruegeria sp. SK021]|nr:hypothetical protein BV911_17445 [Pseudoruegeria sp. SK021]
MEFRRVVDVRAPWLDGLSRCDGDPDEALGQIRADLAQVARYKEEAAWLTKELYRRIDHWNMVWTGDEIAAPPPIVSISSRPPAWSAARLRALEFADAVADKLEETTASVQPVDADLPRLIRRALLSAALNGGLCAHGELDAFARWLGSEDPRLTRAPGQPVSMDLKLRGDVRKKLSYVSGEDDAGPFALRRWLVDGKTLAEIADILNSEGDRRSGVRAFLGRPEKLYRSLLDTLELKAPRNVGSLRAFLDGAIARAELAERRLDRAHAQLAASRVLTFGADPSSWQAALSDQPSSITATDLEAGTASLLDEEHVQAASSQRVAGVRQDPTYIRFLAVIGETRTQTGSDMTSADEKDTPLLLARRIRDAMQTRDWPDAMHLLADWYLHMLEVDGYKVGSIRRYHSTLAGIFFEQAGQVPLGHLPPEDVEELYSMILEADERSAMEYANLRGALRRMHQFARGHPRWQFPDLDEGMFAGASSTVHVRAMYISHTQFTCARNLVRRDFFDTPELAATLDSLLVFLYRTGARIGEATKAMLQHLELDETNPTLFIRPSKFGNNKTPSAHRQVRPLALMSAQEAETFGAYLGRRRLMGGEGPLFGMTHKGRVLPFSRKSVGEYLSRILRQATGVEGVSCHSLRHSAASNLYLAIAEGRDPYRHPQLDHHALGNQLTGWSMAERNKIATAVAPSHMFRDCWQALARHMGHGSPVTSFETYIHLTQFEIFRQVAPEIPEAIYAGLCNRLVAFMDVLRGSAPTVPEEIDDHESRALTVEGLYHALDLIDDGLPPSRAAGAVFAPTGDLTSRLNTARHLSRLATSAKTKALRLQPPERAGRLAPDPLDHPRRETGLAMAQALADLHEASPREVNYWLRATLGGATQSNPGTRLSTPRDLGRWLAVALQMTENLTGRWWIQLITPDRNDPALDYPDWRGVCPAKTIFSKRPQSRIANPVARVRYLMVPEDQTEPSHDPRASYAGSPVFAAHLAAILIKLRIEPES